MACGTPVIASRIGGVPEVVDHGVTGFLVEPGDVHELRDRLEEMTASPASAERIGAAGRERVLDRFTWGEVARRCLDAYEALATPRR
jgi:starch synthase